MRRIAFWLVTLNYLQAGIGFGLSLWLANKLGATGYGVLSYSIVVGSFSATLVGFASDKTLVRDLSHAKDDHAILTASAIQRGFVAILVILGCAVWLLAASPTGKNCITVVIGLFFGALLGLSPTAWYDRRYEMHVHAGFTLAEKVVFAISVTLLLTFSFGIDGGLIAMLCMVGARLVLFGCQWGWALKSFRPTTVNLKANIRFLLQQNTLILGAALANILMSHANQVVLADQQGTASLACYAIALQIVSVVLLLQGQILRLLQPRIAEITQCGKSAEVMRKALVHYCLYAVLVTLSLVGPLAILAPWIIDMLLEPEYRGAVIPLRLLCAWAAIYGASLLVNQFLLCLRLNRSYFLICVGSGILALVLGQALIPSYGATGVAFTLLVSQTFLTLIQVWLVLRELSSLRTVELIPA